MPKSIGEPGGYASMPSTGVLDVMRFTVDSIEVDAQCTADRADPPENGSFVILTMTIMGGDKLDAPGVSLNPNGFYIVNTATGVRESDSITPATYGCVDSGDRLPDQVTRNIMVTGVVVLDTAVPAGQGAIVWSPMGSGTGWEFSF